MSSNRILYLFGAGAVIDWGGPKTEDITNKIKESGFSCQKESRKVTDLIHDFIKRKFYKNKSINFEDIFNVIEELIKIYSDKSKKNKFWERKYENIIDNIFIFRNRWTC